MPLHVTLACLRVSLTLPLSLFLSEQNQLATPMVDSLEIPEGELDEQPWVNQVQKTEEGSGVLGFSDNLESPGRNG